MKEPERVGRVLRLVIDAVNECNLRCLYCHPGEVWRRQQLPLPALRSALEAADAAGVLEVVLTGGEITLHQDLRALLAATHLLRRAASTLITNATKLTPETLGWVAASNLTRICTSVDGVTNDLHGSARGKNLPKVLDGLRRLTDTGKPVTVITVVHQRNWARVIELSEFLAGSGLATQHHLCAPSFSGQARAHYPQLALREYEFHGVQDLVDAHHQRLAEAGLYLTFNSIWPATGARPLAINPSRTMTLQQLSEQVKEYPSQRGVPFAGRYLGPGDGRQRRARLGPRATGRRSAGSRGIPAGGRNSSAAPARYRGPAQVSARRCRGPLDHRAADRPHRQPRPGGGFDCDRQCRPALDTGQPRRHRRCRRPAQLPPG
ncbi:radical SAM protein [Nocardia amikacinitolerans]|uniref:radical SAM protein n=1 Tax=Nocardia amikacinitolerans TaxID=756689 RepID=UPI0020A32811|nr:radical SAM protein [Nocardia amikacinitolerans]